MMFWAVRQLAVPCNYLRIRHGATILESKAVYDFVLPALLTGGTAGVALLLGFPLSAFRGSGFFQSISGLLAILIGFYMAALAAVATFDRAGIDQPLKGGDAILRVRGADGGKAKDKKLSYRQFISYLFGYASFLSFLIYAVLLIVGGIWPKLILLAKDNDPWPFVLASVVEPTLFFLLFFAIWQLFVTSLLGIYFLAERIQSLHDPDR